jgi:hypothetical protein
MTPITDRSRHVVRIATRRCQPALLRRLEDAVPGGFLVSKQGYLDVITPYDQCALDLVNEWAAHAVPHRQLVKPLDLSPADRVAAAHWAARQDSRVVVP